MDVTSQGLSSGWQGTIGQSALGRAGMVALSTVLIAVAAHVSVPLPFTPVPMVLSDLAVLAVGLLLGPGLGFATLLLYLAEGAAGLPVFSPHGPGGLVQMLGPTGGYLMAYPAAAAAAGWLARRLRWQSVLSRGLVGAAVGSALLLCSGAAWLSGLLHLTGASAWHLAIAPFLPAAALKVCAAALLYTAGCRYQRK